MAVNAVLHYTVVTLYSLFLRISTSISSRLDSDTASWKNWATKQHNDIKLKFGIFSHIILFILQFSYLAVCPPGWLNRVQSGCGRCPLLPFGQKLPVGGTAGAALPRLSVSVPRWSASPHCRSCSCNYGNTETTVNGVNLFVSVTFSIASP